jgi:peptidoglycan hydrolase-like protein with peptidoglycan-binding domain
MSDITKWMTGSVRVLLGILVGIIFLLDTTTELRAQASGSNSSDRQTEVAAGQKIPDADALLVARVLGLILEGVTDPALTAPVRFATDDAAPRPDPAIHNGGFKLVSSVITGYKKSEADQSRRTAGGGLLHQDRIGRQISTLFTVDYRLVADGSMVVIGTTLERIYEPIPKISIYIVHADRVSENLLETRRAARLLQYVASHSVSRYQYRKIDRVAGNYYVFAFFMNRMAEDARIDLLISDQAVGMSGDGSNTRTFQENGWHVAYTPARLALDGTPEVFFKVLYTPGRNADPTRHRQTIGSIFTSNSLTKQTQVLLAKLGYSPGAADGSMGPRTRQAIKAFQQDQGLRADGKLTGELFTVLTVVNQQATFTKAAEPSAADPQLVKKVQLYLAEWGYNPGPADGIPGERTRQAIRAFQRDRGLEVNGRISPELAARLTDSSRRAAGARALFESKMWPNLIQRP